MTTPEGAIALTLQVLELAYAGHTEELAAYLDAGTPVRSQHTQS